VTGPHSALRPFRVGRHQAQRSVDAEQVRGFGKFGVGEPVGVAGGGEGALTGNGRGAGHAHADVREQGAGRALRVGERAGVDGLVRGVEGAAVIEAVDVAEPVRQAVGESPCGRLPASRCVGVRAYGVAAVVHAPIAVVGVPEPGPFGVALARFARLAVGVGV
jgi:hypothetical protein